MARGKRKKNDQDERIPSILEPDGSSKEYRRNWARLIQKIYEVDSLMMALSFGPDGTSVLWCSVGYLAGVLSLGMQGVRYGLLGGMFSWTEHISRKLGRNILKRYERSTDYSYKNDNAPPIWSSR